MLYVLCMYPLKEENEITGSSTQEGERTDIEGGVGEEVKTQMGI